MTPILTRIRQHLQAGDLAKLFVDVLGWDRHALTLPVTVAGGNFDLRAIAEKRGVQVFECPPDADGRIPDKTALRAIEKEVTKSAIRAENPSPAARDIAARWSATPESAVSRATPPLGFGGADRPLPAAPLCRTAAF